SSDANSVFVSDNDVYVAGREATGIDYNYVGKFWKNGTPQDLTDGSSVVGVWSIFVSDDEVYVAGGDGGVAKLWVNGTPQVLSDSPNSSGATSVFVDDSEMGVEDFDYTENKISLFPNPVQDILQIETKAGNIQAIELFSITGQRLQTWKSQSEIDLSSFSKGNYFIKISTADNQNITKQIIKN